jgi:hypothetical protein
MNIILNILKGAQFEFLPRAPFYIDTPLLSVNAVFKVTRAECTLNRGWAVAFLHYPLFPLVRIMIHDMRPPSSEFISTRHE